jgi:hypothetical protein
MAIRHLPNGDVECDTMDEFIESLCNDSVNGEHCWHSLNIALTVVPPIFPEKCCWCGERREIRMADVLELLPKHGQHKP